LSEEKLESWGVELTVDVAHAVDYKCTNCESDKLFDKLKWLDCVVGFSTIMKKDNYPGAVIIKCPDCNKLQWHHITLGIVAVLKNNNIWPKK